MALQNSKHATSQNPEHTRRGRSGASPPQSRLETLGRLLEHDDLGVVCAVLGVLRAARVCPDSAVATVQNLAEAWEEIGEVPESARAHSCILSEEVQKT